MVITCKELHWYGLGTVGCSPEDDKPDTRPVNVNWVVNLVMVMISQTRPDMISQTRAP